MPAVTLRGRPTHISVQRQTVPVYGVGPAPLRVQSVGVEVEVKFVIDGGTFNDVAAMHGLVTGGVPVYVTFSTSSPEPLHLDDAERWTSLLAALAPMLEKA